MIETLAFGPARVERDRSIRTARFVARSTIPISALCVVANGVREHLRRLLGVAAEVTLGEATLLDATARAALGAQAHCFLTRGRTNDVLLCLAEWDARRLLDAAFAERGAEPALSPLERSALCRLADELALLFDPLLAQRLGPPTEVPFHAAICSTYVDVRIGAPIDATLGLGLAHEPPAERPAGPSISPALLEDVPCDLRAHVAQGTFSAARLACLAPGEIVRMDTKVGSEAALKVGELVVALGRGGAMTDESGTPTVAAFAVDSV